MFIYFSCMFGLISVMLVIFKIKKIKTFKAEFQLLHDIYFIILKYFLEKIGIQSLRPRWFKLLFEKLAFLFGCQHIKHRKLNISPILEFNYYPLCYVLTFHLLIIIISMLKTRKYKLISFVVYLEHNPSQPLINP